MAEDVKVPEGWRKIPLLEKLAFIKGKAPRKFYNFKEKNTIRYLTPECLRGRNNETLYCNIYEAEIVNDDVVVLWDGSNAGEIFFAKDGAIASTMAKIEIDEKSHKRFFYYYLKLYEPILKYQIKGSGIPHVEKDIFGLLPNTFPSLPEQRKIAEILETIDNAIEKTDRIIEKYKRIKQGLMQDLLTRGIDENGQIRSEETHRFKDSPLGRIPEEWEVVELGEVFKLKSGMTRPCDTSESGNYPIYGGNGILGYTNEKNFDIETIIIGRVGEYCGVVYIASGGWVTDNALYVVVKKRDYNNLFLCYLLNYVNLNQYSAETGQPLMTQSIVYKIQIPLPPLPEQHRIASILSQIDEAIEKEKKYKEKLERIKRGLIEDLLTGKVRVNELIGGGKNIDNQN